MNRISDFTKIYIGLMSIALMIFFSAPQAWAENVSGQAVKIYLLFGSGYRAENLGDFISNFSEAESQRFDRCMADAETYWYCSKGTVTGTAVWPYNDGFTNDEPLTYLLPISRYVDHKHFYGHDQYYEDGGAMGADTSWTCPSGFLSVAEGPKENRTLWCEKVEVESCLAGNPIDVYSGKKYEFEVDYVSPNGAMKVERQYMDQYTGWIVNIEPRIKYVGPGETAVTKGLFNQAYNSCTTVVTQLLSRYKATYKEPSVLEYYNKSVCLELNNNDISPVIYVWLSGKKYRFVGSNGVYLPEGGFEGRLKIEAVPDSIIPGAVWQMTHRDGALSYFDSEGFILKTLFSDGGYLDYNYVGGQLANKTDHSGRSISYIYNDKQRLESVLLPDSEIIQYDYVDNDDEKDTNFWLIAKVTWPDGASEEYAYNEPEHVLGTSAESFLTGKIDSYGNRIGTYKYLGGKATSTEGYGGANKSEISYRRSSYLRLKNSLGIEHTLYFYTQLADGKRLLTRELQPAGSGSVAANKFIYYNSDGQVTETRDYNGNKIQYGYDPALKFKTVEVKAIPASQSGIFTAEGVSLPGDVSKTSTQWDATVSKPTLVAAPGKLTTIVYQGLPDPFNNDQVSNCTAASLDNGPLPVICRVVEQATTDANGQLGFNATLDSSVEARHTLFTYNENGKLLTKKRSPDFASLVTIEYYQESTSTHKIGDVKKIQNALEHSIEYLEYDANGNATKIQDVNGGLTLLTYDSRGRVTLLNVAGQTTIFDYDLNGNLTSITSPNGSTLTREYDGVGRLSAVVDGLLNRIEYAYDLESNLLSTDILSSTGDLLKRSTQVFDALNRLSQHIGGTANQTSQYNYDKNGNKTVIIDPNNNPSTTQQFNALNRIKQVTDSNGGIAEYSYNNRNQITSVTDPRGVKTDYEYNGFGNLITLVSPDTGTTMFTYDGAGNALNKTDANGVITNYQYDVLNRVTQTGISGDPTATIIYSYDDTANGNLGVGRLTSITDSSGENRYRYDQHGNIIQHSQVVDGRNYTFGYQYNLASQLTQATYPYGRVFTFSYDTTGNINGVTTTAGITTTTLASSLNYLPFGPISSITYGNDLNYEAAYDLDYRLTQQIVGTSGEIQQKIYDYDANSNIAAISDNNDINQSQTFSYDVLNRLIDANGGYGTKVYQYDATGNRIILTDNGDDTYSLYDATSNQLLTKGQWSYNSDNHGNIISKTWDTNQGTFWQYNNYNRVSRIATKSLDGQGQVVEQELALYIYNALGQRVSKTVNGITTHYLYSLDGILLTEAQGSDGTINTSYVYLAKQPLAYITADGIYTVHNDHLGTPKYLTNTEGQIVWSARATAFGAATVAEDPDNDGSQIVFNLRFPGQYYDGETGLHYNYFRYYDPSTGRFLTSDPIGLKGGLNTYGYVSGNPIMRIDPSGLAWWNDVPPTTVPVTGQTANRLQCVETCLNASDDWDGAGLLCTGGQEQTGHSENSDHYTDDAVDVAGPAFNNYTTQQVLQCAAGCGFGAGQYEDYPGADSDHWHLQNEPGNGVPALPQAVR